jgi:hypothetical protein
LLAALVAAIALAALFAEGASADNTVLNQTTYSDASGDSAGADIASLIATSYTDGTIGFTVQFANRDFLHAGETVQIFLDLNGDGKADLNFSVWESFEPSYLARWTGSDWANIRQLPELGETAGAISVRVSLSELQSDAGVVVAPVIQLSAGTWTEDSNGVVPSAADDWVPSATSWADFGIKPSSTPVPTTTPRTTPPTATAAAAPVANSVSGKTKLVAPPVSIKPVSSLMVRHGTDAMLRIVLQSASGPSRLFKVCTSLNASSGVAHLSQCRSTESTGGKIGVPFTITYLLVKPGTDRVSISAAAGTARVTGTAIIHVS